MKKYGYVYLISDKHHRRVYVGVTCDLYTRMRRHKQGSVRLLGKRIIGEKLLYIEQYAYVLEAIKREKKLKIMKRAQKEKLISSINPDRIDVAQDWFVEKI